MKEMNALIDTKNGCVCLIGSGGNKLEVSPGSNRHRFELSDGGNWMLPCSDSPDRGSWPARKLDGGLRYGHTLIVAKGDFFKHNVEFMRKAHEESANVSVVHGPDHVEPLLPQRGGVA